MSTSLSYNSSDLQLKICARYSTWAAIWTKDQNFEHNRRKGFSSFMKSRLAAYRVPQAVADFIRMCLGPKAMLKMILDLMGGILSVRSLVFATITEPIQ